MTHEPCNTGFTCELDEQARVDQADRWRGLAGFVYRRARTEDGFRLTFDHRMRDELTALVAIERDCCAWAEWSLREEQDGLALEVTGPPGDIGALGAAFGIQEPEVA